MSRTKGQNENLVSNYKQMFKTLVFKHYNVENKSDVYIKEEYLKNLIYYSQFVLATITPTGEFGLFNAYENKQIDVMGQPLYYSYSYYSLSKGEVKVDVDINDCVILEQPQTDSNIVNHFINRIISSITGKEQNKLLHKTPVLLKGNKAPKTVTKLIEYTESGLPYAQCKGDLFSQLEMLQTNIPTVFDKFQNIYTEEKNELLSLLGIKCNTTIKTERVTVNETKNDEVIATIVAQEKQKKLDKFFDEIKEKYGKEFLVEWNGEQNGIDTATVDEKLNSEGYY